MPTPARGVGTDMWDRLWLNSRRQLWLTVYTKDGPIYVGRGLEFGYTSQGRDVRLGDDTRVYDEDWNLIQNTGDRDGRGVWIPSSQIVSIEMYDPAPALDIRET